MRRYSSFGIQFLFVCLFAMSFSFMSCGDDRGDENRGTDAKTSESQQSTTPSTSNTGTNQNVTVDDFYKEMGVNYELYYALLKSVKGPEDVVKNKHHLRNFDKKMAELGAKYGHLQAEFEQKYGNDPTAKKLEAAINTEMTRIQGNSEIMAKWNELMTADQAANGSK